jgi:hypothetical protein
MRTRHGVKLYVRCLSCYWDANDAAQASMGGHECVAVILLEQKTLKFDLTSVGHKPTRSCCYMPNARWVGSHVQFNEKSKAMRSHS